MINVHIQMAQLEAEALELFATRILTTYHRNFPAMCEGLDLTPEQRENLRSAFFRLLMSQAQMNMELI